MVVLITGKPDSGKTHYAYALAQEYGACGIPSMVLDGDEVRADTGDRDFSDEGRRRNLEKISIMAAQIEKQGIVPLVSVVAPKAEYREMMREKWAMSRLVYLPGGKLWPDTEYEPPSMEEFDVYRKQ